MLVLADNRRFQKPDSMWCLPVRVLFNLDYLSKSLAKNYNVIWLDGRIRQILGLVITLRLYQKGNYCNT